MMIKLGAQTGDPRWSSYLLEKLYQVAAQPAGAELADLALPMFDLLAEQLDALSNPRANLIRELGIYVIGRRRVA